jgi:hypothetical protein
MVPNEWEARAGLVGCAAAPPVFSLAPNPWAGELGPALWLVTGVIYCLIWVIIGK